MRPLYPAAFSMVSWRMARSGRPYVGDVQ